MRIDRNYAYFRPHTDWYTFEINIGYVPTEKAPPEAVAAMQSYHAYTFKHRSRKVDRAQASSNSLDDFGLFTEPMPEDAPRYSFRDLQVYCHQQGKTLAELSEAEIEQFRQPD